PQQIRRTFNNNGSRGWEWGKIFGLLFQSHALFRDAQAILTCNSREAELLQKQYTTKRIVVQPHGVPLPLYQRDHRRAARAAFPRIEGQQVLLCLGRIDPIKNQTWLLDQLPAIAKRHPRALLVLVGACTHETYGEQIQRRIKKSGLESRILLT